jgi:hypothetical protein
MIAYEVVPHVGVGPVRLGMSRDEVRRAMPGERDSFLKGPYSKIETDAFHGTAFQVFYGSEPPAVEYIMLCRGQGLQAFYRGVSVFDTDADEMVRHVSLDAPFDASDWELGYSYIFPDLALSLWRSTVPQSPQDMEGRHFMTIGIGVKGCWDKS